MQRACGQIIAAFVLLASASFPYSARAQERAYFVTYNHQMEEPQSLEVSINPVLGTQRHGNGFLASWTEIEYGLKGWWTTEFYLAGQSTRRDSTLFTGFRWENRYRLLMREHWINPVFYVEYENLNAADKTLLEVVGFDAEKDHSVPNAESRRERLHELETKLILSSNLRGWNVSENFIAEKNLTGGPWELGYALGLSRPLALAATARPCRFCRENFTGGIELYGGAGTARQLTFSRTSHYLAPVVSWQVTDNMTLRVSPGWGLTSTSHRFLLRFGVSYEFPGFGRRLRRGAP